MNYLKHFLQQNSIYFPSKKVEMSITIGSSIVTGHIALTEFARTESVTTKVKKISQIAVS
jgi:hypothetical protein